MAITGGANMTRLLAEMTANIEGKALVKVGFQNGLTYPQEKKKGKKKSEPVSVSQVAFWNEYGTQGSAHGGPIPPRPFFRTMIAKNSPKWGDNLGRILAANGYQAHSALDMLGGKMVEQLQDSIKNGGWQGNSARAIAKKGFDKPLIDSGIMWRDGITAVVVDGDE